MGLLFSFKERGKKYTVLYNNPGSGKQHTDPQSLPSTTHCSLYCKCPHVAYFKWLIFTQQHPFKKKTILHSHLILQIFSISRTTLKLCKDCWGGRQGKTFPSPSLPTSFPAQGWNTSDSIKLRKGKSVICKFWAVKSQYNIHFANPDRDKKLQCLFSAQLAGCSSCLLGVRMPGDDKASLDHA